MTYKRFVILIILAIVVVVGLGSWRTVINNRRGILIMTIVPPDATLSLASGKHIQSNSSLMPGTYKVTISRPDFTTKTVTATVSKQQISRYTIALTPSDDAGQAWLDAHTDQQAIADGAYSQQFDAAAQSNSQNNPIVSALPTFTNTWRLDYGRSVKHPDDPNSVAIIITADTPAGRQGALEWMYDHGYNPADYEIVFQSIATYQKQVNSIYTRSTPDDSTN